ncbi:MAG: hypothetical protein NT133_03275 [Alphaproteobacteria bacterium]|nr:hypothetical protein [Alphaproteobacteria bacterium]
MTPSPAPRPNATRSIASIMDVMLSALLAALLGVARRGGLGRARSFDGEVSGMIAAVLRAEADAELEWVREVEGVAVTAPWRNGRLLPRAHAVVPVRQCSARSAARMRGPPMLGLIS